MSGSDDRSIRLWRLYPSNSVYQSTNYNNATASTHNQSNDNDKDSANDSEDDVELTYDAALSDDDDPNKFLTDFDPSIQSLSHLLSIPASGEVKGLCMSPFNGQILVAVSSRSFNQKSSLDIINIPHWTWNYSSSQRLPYKVQLREQHKLKQLQLRGGTNLMIQSLDDELNEEKKQNPFIENQSNNQISCDFINRPSVIPLPYGARERCITFSPSPNIVFVGMLCFVSTFFSQIVENFVLHCKAC